MQNFFVNPAIMHVASPVVSLTCTFETFMNRWKREMSKVKQTTFAFHFSIFTCWFMQCSTRVRRKGRCH